jgi:hypothetical protein
LTVDDISGLVLTVDGLSVPDTGAAVCVSQDGWSALE